MATINLGMNALRMYEKGLEGNSAEISKSFENRIAQCDSKEELIKLARCYGFDGCAIWFRNIVNHPLMDMDVMLEIIDNAHRHSLDSTLVYRYICFKLIEFEKEGVDTSVLKNNSAWNKICDKFKLRYKEVEDGVNYWGDSEIFWSCKKVPNPNDPLALVQRYETCWGAEMTRSEMVAYAEENGYTNKEDWENRFFTKVTPSSYWADLVVEEEVYA